MTVVTATLTFDASFDDDEEVTEATARELFLEWLHSTSLDDLAEGLDISIETTS